MTQWCKLDYGQTHCVVFLIKMLYTRSLFIQVYCNLLGLMGREKYSILINFAETSSVDMGHLGPLSQSPVCECIWLSHQSEYE